jgi:hypothetical protein
MAWPAGPGRVVGIVRVMAAAERKQVLLRLDPAVYDALARWAGDELRSTNAQIEMLLRRALADAGRAPAKIAPIRGPGRPRKDENEPDEAERRGRAAGE